MKLRFLADANFNRKIVAGLLRREPGIDFALPQAMIPDRMTDPDLLDLAHSSGRIVVSHDVTAMPRWFDVGKAPEARAIETVTSDGIIATAGFHDRGS